MAAPTFLFNSCDGSYEPLLVILGLVPRSKGPESEEIPTITIKINDSESGIVGCFVIDSRSELEGNEYNIDGIYDSCESCLFSGFVDEFKSNENINAKFEVARDEMQTIIQGKLAGGIS